MQTEIPPRETELLPIRSPEFWRDPHPYFKRLRDEFPVTQLADGTYVVSRYEDVNFLLRSTASSSRQVDFEIHEYLHQSVIGMDPPEHTKHRRLINKLLTPKMNLVWVETMRSHVSQALAGVGDDGEIEAVGSLMVGPLHATMCEILAIPFERAPEIDRWVYNWGRSLGLGLDEEEQQLGLDAIRNLSEYSRQCLEAARLQQNGGMLGAWVEAEAQGEITEDEIIAHMVLFLVVGLFSPGTPIASSLERIARDPDLAAYLRSNPEARLPAINEILRLDTPELGAIRVVTEDVTIADTQIPAGATLWLLLSSANRDERVFANPDAFDLFRPADGKQHLAFAAGPHTCMGQNLVRKQVEIVLEGVLDQYSLVELAGEPEYHHTEFSRKWTRLPLHLAR